MDYSVEYELDSMLYERKNKTHYNILIADKLSDCDLESLEEVRIAAMDIDGDLKNNEEAEYYDKLYSEPLLFIDVQNNDTCNEPWVGMI